MSEKITIDYIWKDTKRHFGLPLSFTSYALSEDRLFVKTGMLNERQEEVLLYRIKDITMTRSIGQRIFGVGSITLNTNDSSTPVIRIINIANVEAVKEQIHKCVEKAKAKSGMAITEIY